MEHAVYHVKEVEEKGKDKIFLPIFFALFYIVAAILVVGGGGTTKNSVEAVTTDGTPLCTLPDLPHNRYHQTLDDHILCGGTGGSSTQTSCLGYVAGKWTKYRNDLKFKRYSHVSWRRQDGKVMLIGGGVSKNTSEVVSSSGHQDGFNVRHEV